MTTKPSIKPSAAHPLPPGLAELALIDAPTAAAAGGMSVSWWHDEVRAGRAPQPAIRRPRCTRWRLADVQQFWRERSESDDGGVAAKMIATAKKASAAAKAAKAVA